MIKKGFLAIALGALLLNGCVAPVLVAGGAANVGGSSLPVETQYDDVATEVRIDAILNRLQGSLKGSNIERVSFNGIVLLLGQVPTQAVKEKIAAEVAKIDHVDVVYNQLKVAPPQGLRHYSQDVWITTKVKTLLTKAVNPLHFKVVTESAVVYLMGRVTPEEGQQAADVAREVKGVRKVVKIFSYIHPEKTVAKPQVVLPKSASSVTSSASPESVDQNPENEKEFNTVAPDASD